MSMKPYPNSLIDNRILKVGARSSPLSQKQAEEVLLELRVHHPAIHFDPLWTVTEGDKDLKTSLRTLNKTDFFTREIDQILLKGHCRIGIHSAKDLPDPLPKGLCVVALTRGVDSSDSLVMKEGMSVEDLKQGDLVATSAERREECVSKINPHVRFTDIRGNIGQRLEKLEKGEVQGVVIAEAALIRLGLTHLNRIKLPGTTAQYQGQLGIIARQGDMEMEQLFKCLDVRKNLLHLGIDLPQYPLHIKAIHYPIIRAVLREHR